MIGVVLTGVLDDGTAGLWDIKQHGGTTVVQDPRDAQQSEMPRSALAQVPIDHVTPIDRMAALLAHLVGHPIETPSTKEEAMAVTQHTTFTCPECRGPITEFWQSPTLKEYRCRVGHRYSPASYVAAESETRERTLWAAVLTLEEAAEVMLGWADAQPADKRRLQRLADNNLQAAKKIRELRQWLTTEESQQLTEEGGRPSAPEAPENAAA